MAKRPAKGSAGRIITVAAGFFTVAFLLSHCWRHSGGSRDVSGFISSLGSLASSSLACRDAATEPAFLQQSDAGFKKHIQERLQSMGRLPSIEDLGPGGSVQHLPSRADFESRMLVPPFSCAAQQRLGRWGKGGHGKWVCLAYKRPAHASSAPVVVSIRTGTTDTSFEKEVFQVLQAKPMLFDPLVTPAEVQAMKALTYLKYEEGVGVVGESAVMGARQHLSSVKWQSVSELVRFLKLEDGKTVDILSLDCSGCEDTVVEELHASREFPKEKPAFGQIIIRLNNVNNVKQTMRLLLRLEAKGYRMFHNERDAFDNNLHHVSFIHESLVGPSPAEPPLKFVSGSPFLCSDMKSLHKLLSQAECSFNLNLQRRHAVLGNLRLPSSQDIARNPYSFQGLERQDFESSMLIPTYQCVAERRLGLWGEGGKWACLGFCQPEKVKLPYVVSIGSNGDGSFEAGAFYILDTVPQTFDPFIPQAEAFMANVRHLRFHPIGMTGVSRLEEVSKKHPNLHWLTVSGLFGYLGVTFVDVFKIDCEGCEFAVVEEMKASFTRQAPPFGQILMEIHDTRNVTQLMRLMLSLEDLGYRLFHTEVNAYTPLCWEIGLVHESLVQPNLLDRSFK